MMDDHRRDILAQICTEAMTENEAWLTQGCRLADFVGYLQDLSIPFELKDLQTLPNILLNPKDGTIRLRHQDRKKPRDLAPPRANAPPAKRTRVGDLEDQDQRLRKHAGGRRENLLSSSTTADTQPPSSVPKTTAEQQPTEAAAQDKGLIIPVVDETKVFQLESQMLLEYVKLHYVNETFAVRINKTVTLLQRYLDANFKSGLCVSVHLVGSFATGLASKKRSEIDVYIRLDGGEQLTEVLDTNGLAEALEVALKNCPFFACTPRRGELILGVVDHDFRLKLRPFNVTTFPFAHLQHAAMIAAIVRVTPAVPVFVSIVKAWASQRGLLEILGSFGWTILCLGYMRSRNPPDATSAKNGTPFDPLFFAREIFAFLGWLAATDLLNVSVSVLGVSLSQSPHRGWLTIIDPVTGANIAPGFTFTPHREIVRAAFSIRQEAKITLISLKKE